MVYVEPIKLKNLNWSYLCYFTSELKKLTHLKSHYTFYIIPKFAFRVWYYISKKNVILCVLNKIHPTFSCTWFSTFSPMSPPPPSRCSLNICIFLFAIWTWVFGIFVFSCNKLSKTTHIWHLPRANLTCGGFRGKMLLLENIVHEA